MGQTPRCIYCGKKLRLYRWQDHEGKKGKRGGYGDDRFCGLNCGYKWANRYLNQHPGTDELHRGAMIVHMNEKELREAKP